MFRDLKLRNVMDGFLKFKESVFTGLEECYCRCDKSHKMHSFDKFPPAVSLRDAQSCIVGNNDITHISLVLLYSILIICF